MASAQTVDFHAAALGRSARMSVLVPEGGKERYPALYLHHGLGDSHATFCARTRLAEYARAYELIVVLPDAGASWFCNDPRPGGLAWEDHLAREVVACVDRRFPTLASRAGRGLGGFSMGGYGAMMLALKHPDRFSAVCTQAGSFLFGHAFRPDRPERSAFMQAVAPPGGPYDLFRLAEELAAGERSLAIRFDVGTRDHLLDHNRQFHAHLLALGIAHEYEEAGGGHEWGYVDRRLDTTLRFIATHLAPAR